MAELRPCRRDRPRAAIAPGSQESALEHLRVIRETMEHSAAFTGVSGRGLVIIGFTALAASVIAARYTRHFEHWMFIWLKEAALALVIGAVAFSNKARRTGVPLFSGAGRRMLLGLLPPLATGALLTAALYAHGMASPALIPGLWLLMYGVGVMAGGAHSIRTVPAMGASFLVLGAAALASPSSMISIYMASGFGGLHVIFGAIIMHKHGG